MMNSATTSIRVRGYELGGGGTVTPATMARYAEHARWQSLGNGQLAVGEHMGRGVVRAQHIDLVSLPSYGSELSVETWLAAVGRTSMTFGHCVSAEGATLAEASCTVVLLGDAGPRAAPDAVRDFVVSRPAPRAERLEPAPNGVEPSLRWRVVPSDHDVFGHVNQARYVDFVEDARWAAERSGLAGAERPAAAVTVEYRAETRAGDDLEARVWLGPASDWVGVELQRVGDRAVTCRARIAVA